ncbi:MAG: hypothetical protein ACI8W3_003188 [Myxococcota bacterium]
MFPEADAAVARIERLHAGVSTDHPSLEAAKFYRSELFYRRGDAFNAHVGYRELVASKNPRMAAAARLRLTDLSFDAGKSRSVQLEYETLLPHGEAFGAKMLDWSLRAAEAALDAGDYAGADAWFNRFAEGVTDRNRRDIVEVRRADLDVLDGRPEIGRKRLRALFGRKGDMDIEALAKVRQIALGVGASDPGERIDELHRATSSSNRGVRVYALSVLVHQLLLQDRIDEGVAAITRLAYEGPDPALAATFDDDLERLLLATIEGTGTEEGCARIIRRLGGRTEILLGYAPAPAPFLALGECLEKIELHDLAIAVYRSLTRTFGTAAAKRVALPLARASLASGDVSLARAAAEVNILNRGDDAANWRFVQAQAEAEMGHANRARELLRVLLRTDELLDQSLALADAFSKILDRKVKEDIELLDLVVAAVPEDQRAKSPFRYGAVAMRSAEALRLMGQGDRARVQYRVASEFLPAGSMRDEASYWTNGQELLARKEPEGRGAGEKSPQSIWARLHQYDSNAKSLGKKYQLRAIP